MFDLASTIPPASRIFLTMNASSGGCELASEREPAVVGRSYVS
jgi:hypothetical protein